ncbi:MAG: GAF domain-containing protein [Acidimicrobiales bacterium]|jgi:signal transduction histidine kinase
MSDVPAPGLAESGLLDAILSIASGVDLEGVLRRIVVAACELTDARYGALGVLDSSGEALSEFVTHGLSEEQEAAIGERPKGHGVLGVLINDPRPIRLAELGAHERSFGFPPNHPPMSSFLGVPIRVRELAFGNLYLTEKRSAREFTETDERLLSSLAAAAGVAVDNVRLHERLGELALFADRERIARDLHDTVIQRLFAVGLSLQGLARVVDPPNASERIEAAVDELDLTIADIRSTIFGLEARSANGARAEITRVVTEAREALGFLPRVQFQGPLDNSVTTEMTEAAAAVVREALSNITRHARATRAEVAVAVTTEELQLSVSDDGIGIRRSSPSGHGLRNMAARAEQLMGVFEIRSEPGEGTTVIWRIPL